MSRKNDLRRTAKIVLPKKARKKYSRKRYDFSKVDTARKKGNVRKIRTGPKGGKYVMSKGKKVYLKKRKSFFSL